MSETNTRPMPAAAEGGEKAEMTALAKVRGEFAIGAARLILVDCLDAHHLADLLAVLDSRDGGRFLAAAVRVELHARGLLARAGAQP